MFIYILFKNSFLCITKPDAQLNFANCYVCAFAAVSKPVMSAVSRVAAASCTAHCNRTFDLRLYYSLLLLHLCYILSPNIALVLQLRPRHCTANF